MTWDPKADAKIIEDFLGGRTLKRSRDQAGAILLAALGCCWSAIRDAEPDLPEVVVVVGAASARMVAHFAPLRWRATEANGTTLHEVMVNAEYLDRGPEETLATLLHEAAHAINYVRRVADCSKSQYHNKNFERQAKRLGLVVHRVPHYGLADTSLEKGTASRYAGLLTLLEQVLIHRREPGVQTPMIPTSRNVRASCGCGFLIRVSRSTLARTTILCAECGQDFTAG